MRCRILIEEISNTRLLLTSCIMWWKNKWKIRVHLLHDGEEKKRRKTKMWNSPTCGGHNKRRERWQKPRPRRESYSDGYYLVTAVRLWVQHEYVALVQIWTWRGKRRNETDFLVMSPATSHQQETGGYPTTTTTIQKNGKEIETNIFVFVMFRYFYVFFVSLC